MASTMHYSLRLISILLLLGHCANALVKFTNVKCSTLDKDFTDFRYCRLKVLRRGVVGLNMYAEQYQLPITNISINLSLWKKANGYHPFLYNFSAEFCDFFPNRKRWPFMNIFYNFIVHDSNMNHTCPYNHDLIVKDLVMKDEYFRLLPLPTGDYMFKLKVGAYHQWKADIETFLHVSLDRKLI